MKYSNKISPEEEAELKEMNKKLQELLEKYSDTYLYSKEQKIFKFIFFNIIFGKDNIVEQDIYGSDFINAVLQEEDLEYWVYESGKIQNDCWHIICTSY